jgi:hypothetical protein
MTALRSAIDGPEASARSNGSPTARPRPEPIHGAAQARRAEGRRAPCANACPGCACGAIAAALETPR